MWGLSERAMIGALFQVFRPLFLVVAIVLLVDAYRQRNSGQAALTAGAGLLLLVLAALS